MFSARKATGLKLILLAFALAAPAGAVQSRMDDAFALQQQGKLKEARVQFHAAADSFRNSGDQHNLAAALSAAGSISVSLGDYPGAIGDVEQAVKLRQALHENSELAADLNTIGRAYVYLGDYPKALEHYQEALKVDRAQGDTAGEVTRLNNIGNIHYFLGHYASALDHYQAALQVVSANAGKPWYPWGQKLSSGNMATLYQRLGLEERALELYQQTSGRPEEMEASEYAGILLNQGILYRRLGDPVKALEFYQKAQTILRTSRNAEGEIGALRNIGIVKAMDLSDLPGAIKAFTVALDLSHKTSNTRGVVQASLYLGEIFRRLHRFPEATAHLNTALEAAQKAGLVEDQWKSLYALGRIAEQMDSSQTALEDYRKAITIVESVRSGLRVPALKSDFLADKRDVYDSLINLELQQPSPPVDELFQWMERSRARTLLDRVAARTPLSEASLQVVQSRLAPDTALIEFWTGNENSVALWITSSDAGIVRYGSVEPIRNNAAQLLTAIQSGGDWKAPARELGNKILAGLPLRRHVIIVPDGPLNLPFEVLSVPGSETLLIEQSDISYLPSARFITIPTTSNRRWLFPWSRDLVAFGDPPVSSTDALAQQERWQPLPASADEVRAVAKTVAGRSEIHLGADARKSYLLDQHLEGLPFMHLSTHALVDMEHPDRSRILLASAVPGMADYLFQEEVYNLDLKDVGLVTVSACDTSRGKVVLGEGAQAFSQSFLAAGASATVTSMWKVADGPTATFMQQFYRSLGKRGSRAEALRAAKLALLHSNSELSNPRHWAAFILTGAGWDAGPRILSWSALLFGLAVMLVLVSVALWAFLAMRAKTATAGKKP